MLDFFTSEEIYLINNSAEANTALTNQRTITAQIYSAKVLANASNELKKSNEIIAASNNRYASAMMWFTGALVFVGIVQIIVQIFQIYHKTS